MPVDEVLSVELILAPWYWAERCWRRWETSGLIEFLFCSLEGQTTRWTSPHALGGERALLHCPRWCILVDNKSRICTGTVPSTYHR